MSTDSKDESFAALFEESQTQKGRPKAVRVGDVLDVLVVQAGKESVFVELDGKREGFIEASELHNEEGELSVRVGERIKAHVVEIDRTTGVVRMGVPKPTAAVGAVVTGTVERVESFGIFVQLDSVQGRSGRGLVPNVELGTPRGAEIRKLFPQGTKVTARVMESPDGRLRLSIRGAKEQAERNDYEGYQKTQKKKPEKPGSLGTLGDLLNRRAEKPKKR